MYTPERERTSRTIQVENYDRRLHGKSPAVSCVCFVLADNIMDRPSDDQQSLAYINAMDLRGCGSCLYLII